MLENGVGNVEKLFNKRNGLRLRVCGRLLVIVIMLIEKKSEPRFFTFVNVGVTALAESLVFPKSLKNHANIITLDENLMKSTTYAMFKPNKAL